MSHIPHLHVELKRSDQDPDNLFGMSGRRGVCLNSLFPNGWSDVTNSYSIPVVSPGCSLADIRANTVDPTLILSAASAPTPAAFDEQFAGSSVDTNKWSGVGTGAVTVSGGEANFACRSSLSTQGKYTVGGETIVVEARMAGTGALRDTVFALYEEGGSSIIQAGDTNYRGVGLYLLGTGSFALGQTGNGMSTSAFKEYRLTLSGRSAKVERGDTLNMITESVTRDLPSSISGKTFYLLVGTGGPDYCPGSVDWITINSR